MQIQSAQEALFITCEMERGAVQLYERALHMMESLGRKSEPLYAGLGRMLTDERRHLRQFQNLYLGLDAEAERRLTLLAVANGLLFEGGLVGAVRSGLLQDVESMLQCAMEQEAKAAETYRLFAEQSSNTQAKRALLSIAEEEDRHLSEMQSRQ